MLLHDQNQKNETPKTLFNPTKEEFVVQLRNDDNTYSNYIIHAMDMATFPTYIADRIEKRLVDKIFFERGVKENSEIDMAKIKEEIQVRV